MNEADNRSVALRTPARQKLAELLEIDKLNDGSSIEVTARLRETAVNVRQLYSFLRLLDRSYGRVLFSDLKLYAWRKEMQLTVAEMRSGSWEIVLTHAISLFPTVTPILVVYLLLKVLPSAAERLGTAYNSFEQGRLARANRKLLRTQIAGDDRLGALPARQQADIAATIDVLVRDEPTVGKDALEFAAKNVISVEIKVTRETQT